MRRTSRSTSTAARTGSPAAPARRELELAEIRAAAARAGVGAPFLEPETDCRIEHEGRTFSAGGAYVDPWQLVGYCTEDPEERRKREEAHAWAVKQHAERARNPYASEYRTAPPRMPRASSGLFTAWDGRPLGRWSHADSKGRRVNSCIGERIYSIHVVIFGREGMPPSHYVGQGFGLGMSLRAKRVASERRKLDAALGASLENELALS